MSLDPDMKSGRSLNNDFRQQGNTGVFEGTKTEREKQRKALQEDKYLMFS